MKNTSVVCVASLSPESKQPHLKKILFIFEESILKLGSNLKFESKVHKRMFWSTTTFLNADPTVNLS